MATQVNSTGNNVPVQISREGRQTSIELGFLMGALGLPAQGFDVADESAFYSAYQKGQEARGKYPGMVAMAESRIRDEQ